MTMHLGFGALVALLQAHQWDGDETDPHCLCGIVCRIADIPEHQASLIMMLEERT
jgi:hypothetical protein